MYNNIKIAIITFLISLVSGTASITQSSPQTVSTSSINIYDCYDWARENYPLINQLELIDRTASYNLSNASKGNLPQISMNGQATYQSEVTQFPISIPNVEIPVQDKDQYKVYGEIYQPLSNFSNVNSKKKQLKINAEIDIQTVEIDLYKLKERVNQLYFGTLLIDSKIGQLKIILSDLDSALVKVNAHVTNGTATLTDQQLLQVERISILQQIEENIANKNAYLKMLSALTGKEITDDIVLEKPEIEDLPTEINRPELLLFNLQKQSIALQNQQINSALIPNIGLFIQAGYGRPGLNFLSTEFSAYYIGGLKINWNISSLYTYKNTKEILSLTSEQISNQQRSFLLNTKLTQTQLSSEFDKYKSLIDSDQEIIKIREAVLQTAQVQLSNGLITTLDYIQFLSAVDKARQMLSLHQTQLLLAMHNLKINTGN